MQLKIKVLATAAVIGTMAVAALPSSSQADTFSTACSALGLPSSTTPISLGALGGVTLTLCSAAVVNPDPCPAGTTPLVVAVPGVLNLDTHICL